MRDKQGRFLNYPGPGRPRPEDVFKKRYGDFRRLPTELNGVGDKSLIDYFKKVNIREMPSRFWKKLFHRRLREHPNGESMFWDQHEGLSPTAKAELVFGKWELWGNSWAAFNEDRKASLWVPSHCWLDYFLSFFEGDEKLRKSIKALCKKNPENLFETIKKDYCFSLTA